MTPGRRGMLLVGGLAVLLLLGTLAGGLHTRLDVWFGGAPQGAVALRADPACNPVGGPCTAHGDAIAVTLRLEAGLRPLEAFDLRVDLAGPDAAHVDTVAVRFAMPGMDMGLNRFQLSRRDGGTWEGQAMLPVCSTGRGDWLATVVVAGDPAYTAEFSVVAGR